MKTILITGSSRGIGKAIARLAHTQGYRVILHGKTGSQALRKLHEQLEGSLETFFDVADKEATEQAIRTLLDTVGTVDVLVNNAGIARNFISEIAEVDDGKAIEEYTVNVLGTLHCIQAVLPAMLEKGGGSVINISSTKGYPNLTTLSTLTYALSKAGVISLTKALAKAYPTVRFNAVAPGYVETDQTKDWSNNTLDRAKNGSIVGRIGMPAEIAPLILFLASDDASFIRGADYLVDGGYAIKDK